MFKNVLTSLEKIAKGIDEGNKATQQQLQEARDVAKREQERRDEEEREKKRESMERDPFFRYVARMIIHHLIQLGYDRIDPVHAKAYKPGEAADDGRDFDIGSDKVLKLLTVSLQFFAKASENKTLNAALLRREYFHDVIRNHYWSPILDKEYAKIIRALDDESK